MYLNNKIDDRLNKMFNNTGDPFMRNLSIRKDIEDKLLHYQLFHVFNMLTALDLNTVILDCSDTGTGKTYTTIATILQKGLKPFIISPVAAINTWKTVCKYFKCQYIDIINYEAITTKYPNWPAQFNNDVVFVFDEVHKCKNPKTINACTLMKTRFTKNKKILLSATLVDKIVDFTVFGYMLEFYSNIRKGPKWIKNVTEEYNNSLTKHNPLKDKIFPYKGSKMSVKEIKGFPSQKIILHKLTLEPDANINTKWSNISDIIQLRMALESNKIEIFFNLTVDYLDNDLSVVIFINFINNMQLLSKAFKRKKIAHYTLYSDISPAERDIMVEDFQKNKVHVIICTYGTGGASISLHDLLGRGRASIISLPESGIAFNQSLGRTVRAGSLSTPIQVIPIYSKTYERVMYTRIKEKVKNLNQFGECSFADINFDN